VLADWPWCTGYLEFSQPGPAVGTVKGRLIEVEEARMVTKTVVKLVDDLDGSQAEETVRFGVGGTEYEIDLSKKNVRAFRARLGPFVEHARKGGGGPRRRPARPTSARERSVEIRAWARAQGITISERGRIPASVVAQYEAQTS
jgi:hypothetical protein